jgi:hypothetical protein
MGFRIANLGFRVVESHISGVVRRAKSKHRACGTKFPNLQSAIRNEE